MEFFLRQASGVRFIIFTFISFSIGLAGSVACGASPKPIQPSTSAADVQLNECLRIAKSGDISRAFQLAQQTKLNYSSERMFIVSYVNTLLAIADENDTTLDVKILNEAIRVVNEVRNSKRCDGKQDPELSFHFMQSLGKLSEVTTDVNERVSSKIRIYEGQIANNLKSNPQYPKDALEALAAPMFSMAQGYAIREDQQATFTALRNAVDVGFGDFEMVLNDPVLARLEDDQAIEELVDNLRIRYKRSVAKWSRTVVAQFQPFPFDFNLSDIEGGQLSRADFTGKVLVVDLWATWCPPCRKGIPHYIELQKKFAYQGVNVLGVSMDNPEAPQTALQTVQQFVEEQQFNYPCAMGDQSFAAQIPGQQILPTTLFIDSSGNVRYIARGYHDYEKIEAITKILANESQPVQTGMSYSN